MHKFYCFVISIRKNLFSILLLFFTICLVLFSKSNLEASKSGFSLWITSIIPSLFPFFVATDLLSHTPIVSFLGRKLTKFMRPLFHVPGEGSFALLMGLISGYPMGAKIVTDFRNQGICSKEEGERLLAFTNNSGPLFIVGTVGISFFADTSIGLVLLITHILACLTVGLLFRFWKYHSKPSFSHSSTNSQSKRISISNLGELISASIVKASSSLIVIGGFVILFSVILSILQKSHLIQLITTLLTPLASLFGLAPQFLTPLLSGLLEITNGMKQIAAIPQGAISLNIILCGFLLGFGGISVLLQVWSIISKSDLSILPYFLGKILHGILAAFYTYLVFTFFPFLSLDIVATASFPSITQTSFFLPFFCFLALFAFVFWSKSKLFIHKRKKLE